MMNDDDSEERRLVLLSSSDEDGENNAALDFDSSTSFIPGKVVDLMKANPLNFSSSASSQEQSKVCRIEDTPIKSSRGNQVPEEVVIAPENRSLGITVSPMTRSTEKPSSCTSSTSTNDSIGCAVDLTVFGMSNNNNEISEQIDQRSMARKMHQEQTSLLMPAG